MSAPTLALAFPQVAQTAPPAASAADELKAGFRLYFETSDYDSAARHLETALALAVAEKNRWAEAEAHRGLGIVSLQTERHQLARTHLDQALTVFEELKDRLGMAKVRAHLGSLARATGNAPRARELFELALAEFRALGERREMARVLLRLAMASADVEKADQFSSEGLQFAREVGDRQLEAQLLHNWGDRNFSLGKFVEAWPKYEQAAACFEQAGARSDLARVYVSMGRLLRAHGRPERSLEYYRRALSIQQELGDKRGVVQALNAMAVALQNLQKHDAALQHYRRALALARELGWARTINFQLGNLANAEISAGHWTEGAALLQRLLLEDTNMEASVAAYRYAALSEAHLHFRRYDEALLAAEKAVRYAREDKNIEFLPLALAARALAKHKAGNTREGITDLAEARQVIEQLRSRVLPADFLKRGFGDVHQDVFGIAIEFLFEVRQYEAALEVAEQARARAFVDLLASKGISPVRHDSAAAAGNVVRRDTSPNVPAGQLATPSELVNRGPGAESTSFLKDLLSPDLQLSSSSFVAPPSVSAMRAVARQLHSTILTYWVNKDSAFVWCIRPNGRIDAKRLQVSAQRLTTLVRQTRGLDAPTSDDRPLPPSRPAQDRAGQQSNLAVRGGESVVMRHVDRRAWSELYRLLIAPVRGWLPQQKGALVSIVPHGPLLLLSFAALKNEHGSYLVETYALHYVSAISVLEFTTATARAYPRRHGQYLLVADAAFSSVEPGDPLPPLAGARREIRTIKRLLPGGDVTILEGASATEERVRSNAAGKTVIHFATHAVVHDTAPMESFLALASSSKDSDGRLTAEEVYRLSIAADLVVLSACRSSGGIVSGDGVAGLARAFFYAGSTSVLGTLWNVADEPSSRLLPSFYRSWLRLHSKAAALRQAQLELLRDLRNGRMHVPTALGTVTLREDPSLWAGFLLQGSP